MEFSSVLVLLVNLVLIQGRTDVGPEDAQRAVDSHVHLDVYASAIAKAHYNPWFCNYFKEPGYKCTSCSSALHCYPGNFALLVQCAGRLPYCSNGYCSATKAAKCIEEPSKFKTPSNENITPSEIQDSNAMLNGPNEENNTKDKNIETGRYI